MGERAAEVMFWRRLDTPGHDTCRLVREPDGWLLRGAAVFRHEEGPAQLAYAVRVGPDWHARDGRIDGWVGDRLVKVRVHRSALGWELDGRPVESVRECRDLDFGFTPATNVLQLRRVALEVGQSASVPVAWVDVPALGLSVNPQRYERRTASTYWYEAPRFEYEALLEVGDAGFVSRYPGLWELER